MRIFSGLILLSCEYIRSIHGVYRGLLPELAVYRRGLPIPPLDNRSVSKAVNNTNLGHNRVSVFYFVIIGDSSPICIPVPIGEILLLAVFHFPFPRSRQLPLRTIIRHSHFNSGDAPMRIIWVRCVFGNAGVIPISRQVFIRWEGLEARNPDSKIENQREYS